MARRHRQPTAIASQRSVKIVPGLAKDTADLEVELQKVATRQGPMKQISMTDARFTQWVKHVSVLR
jgi:hypothetical protein